MSTTIDSKVVSMQFDNKQFEQNVAVSMSTLDKLKQKLNFSGAEKGLDNVSAAAKNVNMTGLANSVETVSARFSALQVMGVTALANITNSAVNAGKRMLSALTIDPVKTGFSEYELKMNSVQTIMASTGESIQTVNKYLEELNTYSDQTIYSFSDMTQNIGKFTNAGVKLEDAVAAIKGISNEAALSGANANEASRAMYNFSQALSAGYVKLIDWKSIENANMATKGFKDELIKTALEMGTVTEAADGMYTTLNGTAFNATKNFNETLQDQWMTSEVLINTLKKYADETTDIGKKASAAATEVKTFTQLWDTLKESAQSGWAKTWELLVGDLLEAKSLLTGISKVVGGFIDRMNDWRNNILEGALGSPFKNMQESLEKILNPAKKVAESLEGTKEMLESIEEMANRVIRGDFGNGEERLKIFTEQGWDYARVQNKVNELMGVSTRHAVDEAEAQEEVAKARETNIETLMAMSEEQLKAAGFTEEDIESLKTLAEYSEKTGISVKELSEDLSLLNGRSLLINSFKNMFSALGKVLTSIKDAWQDIFPPKSAEERAASLYNMIAALHKFSLTLSMNKESAEKLRKTFAGLFALLDIILTLTAGPLKIAFTILKEILAMFDLDILDVTAAIGDAIVNFRDWIKENNFLTKALEKLKPFIVGFAQAISDWFGNINFTKLFADIVAHVNAAKEAFADWFKGLKEAENVPLYILQGIVSLAKGIGGLLKGAVIVLGDAVKDLLIRIPVIGAWLTSFDDSNSALGRFIGRLREIISAVKSWVSGIKDAENIPKYLIEGLVNGLKSGAKLVFEVVSSIAKGIINFICDILGIHSPSTVFMAIGGFIIAGLIAGLLSKIPGVSDFFKNLGTTITESFGGIDVGKILAIALAGGLIVTITKLFGMLSNLSSFLKSTGDMLEDVGNGAKKFLINTSKGFKDIGKGVKNFLNAKAVLIFAKAIAILALSLIALSFINPGKLWGAVGAIAALSLVLIGLMVASSKMTETLTDDKMKAFAKYATLLLSLTGSLLIFAIAAKLIGSMDWGSLAKAGAALVIFGGIVVGFMAATKLAKTGKSIDSTGVVIMKIAGAMLLMTIVAKIAGSMDWGSLAKAGAVMVAFGGIIVGLMAATKLAKSGKNMDATGIVIMKVATAMLLMIIVAKIAAGMSPAELIKGALTIVAFGGIVVGLMTATKLAKNGKSIEATGKVISKIAGAMLLMIIVAKIAASMSPGDLIKGTLTIAAFGGIVVGLMAATKLVDPKSLKGLASTLLGISAVIGIMALTITLMGLLSPEHIIKGLVVVALLGGMIVGLIAATKLAGAGDLKGSLIGMAIVIGTLALLMITLTLIDPTKLVTSVAAIAVTLAALALALSQTKNIDPKAMGSLIAIAGIVAVLGTVLILLSTLSSPMSAVVSAVALSLVLIALTGALRLMGKMQKDLKKAWGTIGMLAALTGAMVIIGVLLIVMSKMEFDKAIINAVAITVLMAALVGALWAISKMQKDLKKAGSAVLMLLALAGVLFVLTAALAVMSNINGAFANAVILTVFLGALVGVLALLGSMSKLVTKAKKGIFPLILVSLALYPLVGALVLLSNVNNALSNALALTVLLGAITAVLVLLGSAEPLTKKAWSAVASLAIISLSLLTLVVVLLLMSTIPSALTNALALGVLLAAMTVVLLVLSNMSTRITTALLGAVGLIGIAAALSLMALAMQGVSGVSWGDIGKGLLILAGAFVILGVAAYLLAPVSTVIVALAASLVLIGASVVLTGVGLVLLAEGFTVLAEALSANSPALVAGISALITGLIALIPAIIQGIGQGIVEFCAVIVAAAPAIAEAVLAVLTAIVTTITGSITTILEGLGTVITAVLDFLISVLPKFAEFVVVLVTTIIDTLITLMPKFTEFAIVAVTALIDTLITLMPKFSEFIVALVTMLIDTLITLMPKFTEFVVTLVTAILDVILELAPKIIETVVILVGMILDAIVAMGDKIIETLVTLVGKILEAVDTLVVMLVETITSVITTILEAVETMGVQLIETIVTLITTIVEAIGTVVNTIVETITSMITTILEAVSTMGTALIETIVTLITTIVEAIGTVVNTIVETITSMITTILEAVSTMGTALIETITTLLTTIVESIGTVITTIVETITSVITTILEAVGSMGTLLIETIMGIITSIIEAIGTVVTTVIDTVATIIESITGLVTQICESATTIVTTVLQAVQDIMDAIAEEIPGIIDSAFNLIISFINGLADAIDGNSEDLYAAVEKLINAIINAVIGFFGSIGNIAKDLISKFTGGMKSKDGEAQSTMGDILTNIGNKISSAFTNIKEKGKELLNKFKEGMEAKKKELKDKMGSLIENAKGAISEKWESMKSAGKDMIDGFKAGVQAKAEEIKNAATNVIKGAVDSIKSFLGIKSPSRLFMGFGRYVDEGFAIGVTRYAGEVDDSVRGMGESAVKAMNTTLSSIADAINTDIDSQPTIRPVLDLTDVESKAGRIGGLLNGQSLSATVRAAGGINAMMNARSQNGSNDDIISALDKLGDKLGSSTGDNYQINGVTYDDGSNIRAFAEAVVRQSRVARRV